MSPFSNPRIAAIGRHLRAAVPVAASALLLACAQPDARDGEHDAELDDIEEPTAEAASAITGSWPVVALGCAFPDAGLGTPGPMSSFGSFLVKNDYPGINHYFRSVSGDLLNLAGSAAFGWFTLPHNKSYYLNGDGSMNWGAVADACIPLADSQVYFPFYKGIMIVSNNGFPQGEGGPELSKTLDGTTKSYGISWVNYSMMSNDATTVVHETGHMLGLHHAPSSNWFNGCNSIYSNVYDPMSAGSGWPPYFGVANRNLLGWIPAARSQSIAAGATTTVYLDRVDSTSGTVMAKIPVVGSMYYTVEARRKDAASTYESDLPHEGVNITWVEGTPNKYWDVWFIDADQNCETAADEGVVWTPGETFYEPWFGASVTVLSTWGSGYKVSITAPYQLKVDPTVGKVVVSVPEVWDRECTGAACRYGVAPQKTVTLNAVALTQNMEFTSWTGCPSPNGATCTVTMTAAMNVTANFSPVGDCYPDCFSDCLTSHTSSYCSSFCNSLCY